jgi:hypothetical protein
VAFGPIVSDKMKKLHIFIMVLCVRQLTEAGGGGMLLCMCESAASFLCVHKRPNSETK